MSFDLHQKYLNEIIKNCKSKYGIQVCVITQIVKDSELYEFMYLDNCQPPNLIYKSKFYDIIPGLLENKYTVIIVEYIKSFHSDSIFELEIICTHHPVQKFLTLPPLFF